MDKMNRDAELWNLVTDASVNSMLLRCALCGTPVRTGESTHSILGGVHSACYIDPNRVFGTGKPIFEGMLAWASEEFGMNPDALREAYLLLGVELNSELEGMDGETFSAEVVELSAYTRMLFAVEMLKGEMK